MNILYIILKHVVWRFRIYNCFREIFKFLDSTNTLRNFAKSVFAHIFAKFEYFAKVIIYSKLMGKKVRANGKKVKLRPT